MATKVKPTRLQITGTPQVGQVPTYVDKNTFAWGNAGQSGYGRFLSLWNSATGQPISFPESTPYSYNTGDYFMVNVVSTATPPVNYRPDGSSYTGAASSVTESDEVEIGDVYVYDGSAWLLQSNHGKTVTFANIAGQPTDNINLAADLNAKQDNLTAGNGIDIDASNKISTTFVYGESTTAAATVQKEVSIPSITELNVGQVIIVKPTVTSTVVSSTLKLNSFPAYKMLYNGAEISTSTDSIVWSANIPSLFYLDEVSGTRYWRFLGHGLDSNTTYTLNRLIDPSRYHVGTGTYAFSRYSLVMEKADGTWEKITNTAASYSTGTTKTVNTNGFRLGHIRYYNTTTNLANGALVATSALDIQAPSVNAAYSFNCGTAPGWAVGTPIYLVGSIGADGLFYLDTTQRWSTQLPNTNDGKLYIRLGTALSADNANFSLITEKPIFYYDNGIKIYQQADNKQDVISDLASIRSGATCGSTSVQPGDLACYAQCCDIPDTSCFQLTCNLVCDLNNADNVHYPSAKAVADAIQGAGGGDMMKSVYDPCNCNDDAFDYCNFHNTPTIPDISNLAQCCDIPTNNCQLTNGCGYTTCTGTVSTCADIISKLGYTPYNSTNPNGYTTCTGTLQACDIANLAQCCDIPTNNNQLANGCGYITGINCLDVTSALGYTPYNAGNPCNYINNFAGVVSALGYTPYNTTNPCGFTSCTGTVVASDLTAYAKSCDLCAVATSGLYCDLTGQPTIPTDNSQLANGCGYTTCTGTLVPSDIAGLVQESCIACINGCCLTQGGNICIQGGGGGASNRMEYLVVGGGGGGNWCRAGGGGGAVNHGYIKIANMCIGVGLGGAGATCSGATYCGGNGGCSYMCGDGVTIISNGGCGVNNNCVNGGTSGSGKEGGTRGSYSCRGVGGGGATGFGGNGLNTTGRCYAGNGGTGYMSNISGELCGYGGGGGGGNTNCCGCDGLGADGGGAGGNSVTSTGLYGRDGTRGGGGGGGNGQCGGNGGNGIVIISYDSSLGCTITGGDCCYLCNGRCIHIFTQDGTLTVN